MFWVIVIIGLLLIAALMIVAIYNRLVALRQNVFQGTADIDAQLRQRHDLIPNLVNTVKGYAAHEQGTLDAVISARNKAAEGSLDSADEAQLRLSLDKMLALAEAYPDLKANSNFQALQGELADLEDKLSAARRALNAAVSRYNTGRESFPAVLFAASLGFQVADFNQLDDSEKGVVDQVPDVRF